MRVILASQKAATSKRWLLLLLLLYSFFALSAASAATVPASSGEVWVVDLRGKSREEKLAAFALQGLLNRKGPRVFVLLGNENAWQDWKFESGRAKNVPIWDETIAADFAARYSSIQDAWMEILAKEGYTFQPISLAQLLKSLRAEWEGWILYQDFSADLAPVSTWAGLERAVPVTAALLQQFTDAGVSAPVLHDYCEIRREFSSDPRLEGHRWMLANLYAGCRKDGAVSRNRTYNLDSHDTVVDVDQAVQNQWVVYDLSHDAVANHSTKRMDQDPPDKEILDRILSGLDPFSFVYGWGRSGEENFIRSLARNGILGEVSGVPNNSFFAKLPAPSAPYQQKRHHHRAEEVELEEKVYVTFMVNEGDTLKAANTFQLFGSWLQPERGKVPINWGMEPNLLLSHPWLMHYYYRTMSENDYFFAPPSGWGYSHPGFLPEEKLSAYADKVRQGMKLADLRYINVWWLGELRRRNLLDSFFEQTGAAGHVEWTGRQQVEFRSEKFVNICSNHFYTYRVPVEKFATQLIEETHEIMGPWFIAIYGAAEHATPYKFSELAKRLPSDRFKIVLLDEFFAAATKARTQIEGRVRKPAPNAPKGVAP